ncbi:hypothetical protein CCACVL1_01986 [Corchorus capsularis]|uniref:Uncharacterized protein n=1 Tax=Corchorus capsularis TaxID=210143 RepID=A0A1R3KDW9_COCAP|nr:hypothetical protein CCACVL1_01986 [Corchorus capsularis]
MGASSKEVTGSSRFATIGTKMELEFLLDSEIGRMLAEKFNSFVTSGAKLPNQSAVNCERSGTPYKQCTPSDVNKQKVPCRGGQYNRECPRPSN